jgi:uncharacterized membrane protein YdjX (TVP38/TMEM64 family)
MFITITPMMENESDPNVKPAGNGIRTRLLALALFLSIVTLIIYKTGLLDFFMDRENLLRFIDSMGPAGFVGFILLQVMQVVVAPIPGEATGLIGGFLYGPLLGTALSTVGLTIGSYVAFKLARVLGRPFVERFVSKSEMSRFDYLLHHKGAFLMFLLFLIPGTPKDSLCYVLGLSHISTLEFLVIGGTGRLFGTILLGFGGNFIRREQYYSFFILLGAAVVVIFLAMAYRERIERLLRVWRVADYRKRKARREAGQIDQEKI